MNLNRLKSWATIAALAFAGCLAAASPATAASHSTTTFPANYYELGKANKPIPLTTASTPEAKKFVAYATAQDWPQTTIQQYITDGKWAEVADTFTTTTVQLPVTSALGTLAIHPDSCKGEQAEVTATNGFGGTDWQVLDDLYWCYASGSVTGITSGYNDQCIASGIYNCVGRVNGTYGSRSAYVDWVSTSYGYGLAQEWTEWQVNETGIGEYYPWIQSYGRADGSYYAPGSATNRTH